jgi:hypothetical protein
LATAAPKVDDIQFLVVGDVANADYPSRPWETPTREELMQQVVSRSREVQNAWSTKINIDAPEAAIFRDLIDLKPYDEQALKKELETVFQPKIRPTVETPVNTKDHPFITDFLASRFASFVEDPAFYFSYGEDPSLSIKPNWEQILNNNVSQVIGKELIDSLENVLKDHAEAQDMEKRAAAAHKELVAGLQADHDLVSNRELLAKTLREMNAFDPQQVAQMVDIFSINPLSEKLLPAMQRHGSDWTAAQNTASDKVYNDFIATAQALVKDLQANGLRIDPAKVAAHL